MLSEETAWLGDSFSIMGPDVEAVAGRDKPLRVSKHNKTERTRTSEEVAMSKPTQVRNSQRLGGG